jgi:hypothetical protein
MVDHVTCAWTGASGKKYIYEVCLRHPEVTHNQPGNFIYARLDERKRWVPIYIGEGNLTQRAAMDRRVGACIEAHGATHVHVHVNFEKEDRIAEEKDLLEQFPQVYLPEGCNEKRGS